MASLIWRSVAVRRGLGAQNGRPYRVVTGEVDTVRRPSEGYGAEMRRGAGNQRIEGEERLLRIAIRALAERVWRESLCQWTHNAGRARFCGGRCGGCPPAQGKPLAADRPR